MKTTTKELLPDVLAIYEQFKIHYELEMLRIPEHQRKFPENYDLMRNLDVWFFIAYYSYQIYSFHCSNRSNINITTYTHAREVHLNSFKACKPLDCFLWQHIQTLLTKYEHIYIFPELEHELVIVMCK